MEIREIKEFADQQLDAAQQRDDKKESGLLLLLTAAFLLQQVRETPGYLPETPEKEPAQAHDLKLLRTAFLRCGSASESIREIFDRYRSPLQEAYRQLLQELENNLKQLSGLEQESAKIREQTEQAKRQEEELREREAELLAQEEAWKRQLQEFSVLQKRAEDCRALAEQVLEAQGHREELQESLAINDRLLEGIRRNGIFDAEDLKEKSAELERQARKLTEEYDRLLGGLQKDAQQLFDSVAERQKKKN